MLSRKTLVLKSCHDTLSMCKIKFLSQNFHVQNKNNFIYISVFRIFYKIFIERGFTLYQVSSWETAPISLDGNLGRGGWGLGSRCLIEKNRTGFWG